MGNHSAVTGHPGTGASGSVPLSFAVEPDPEPLEDPAPPDMLPGTSQRDECTMLYPGMGVPTEVWLTSAGTGPPIYAR